MLLFKDYWVKVKSWLRIPGGRSPSLAAGSFSD